MKKLPYVCWILLLLFVTNGCKMDNLDFSKLSKTMNLKPQVVAPVAKVNVTLWDLFQSANLNNTSQISKDPNGLISIMYKQDSLYTYNVRDFLDFPTQESITSGNKQLGEISPGNVSVFRTISLSDLAGALGGNLTNVTPFDGTTILFPPLSFTNLSVPFNMNQIADFTSVTISNGSVGISLENQLKVPVTVQGSYFDITYNREIAGFSFSNLAPNQIANTSVPLAGMQLSNNLELRLKTFETPGSATPVIINLKDYLKITFDLKDVKISAGRMKIASQVIGGFSGDFDFSFPDASLKAFSSVLKNGIMTIKTTNATKLTGSLHFILPEIKKGGVPVEATIPMDGSSTSIDLSQANINFSSDPAQPYNRIPYTYSLQVNSSNGYVDFVSTDYLRSDINLNSMAFKSITGDFGKRVIDITPGNFDLNVDLLQKIDGNFKLVNPTISLFIRNSIGMPAAVSINLTGTNKAGATASLNTPVFTIPVPANLNAGIATKTVVFDKQNSNIVNFIALPPTKAISYNGQVNFNTVVPVTLQNPNFLDMDATFGLDLLMQLPLELQVSNLSFIDTTAITGSDFNKIESADLIINAQNGIPLDVAIQLSFIDSTNISFDISRKWKVISAATVDASGVITPVKSTQTINLDKMEMEFFRRAKNIVFTGTVSVPAGGTGVAPMLSDSKIDLNVVIKANTNL